MNSGLKTALYIVGSFLIIGLVASVAIQLLIWILPIIVVLYVILKISKYFSGKIGQNSNNTNYTSEFDSNFNDEYSTKIDDSSSEVIDVEYEDISK